MNMRAQIVTEMFYINYTKARANHAFDVLLYHLNCINFGFDFDAVDLDQLASHMQFGVIHA